MPFNRPKMELFQKYGKGDHRLLNGEAGLNENARPVGKRLVGMSKYIVLFTKRRRFKDFYRSNNWKGLLNAYCS